jgi:hypothetical protein
MKAFKYVKGKHTKKTTTFVKASLAYCHITIPSLSNSFRKLELLLHCAEVALLNQCLPQTDTFLKAAISLIPDLASTNNAVLVPLPMGSTVNALDWQEEKLAEYINHLLSFLVLAPGHPEHGPFYIVQGLLNALPKFPWQPTRGLQCRVYCNMLLLLCTFRQKSLPYHIHGVQSNDELYGGAPGYLRELEEMISACVAEILLQLTSMGEKGDATSKFVQAKMALDLAQTLIGCMTLSREMVEFVYRLVDLANRQKSGLSKSDLKYLQVTVEYLLRQLQDSVADFALVAIPKLQMFLK